ncbi:MAG: SIMPL domain-containing protein [Chthoniobacteraceae bacterium]|nr:SIMPL domain-containing protein [Chthoniobacteraceae bacterium]
MDAPRCTFALSAFFLAAGLGIAGFFVGNGVSRLRPDHRTVSVKGLSEKEVPASIAIWTLGYSTAGDTVKEINGNLDTATKTVVAFLKQMGFEEKEIAVQPPLLNDLSLVPREKDVPPPPIRFTANQSVLLRTAKVDLIKQARAASSSLMASGVQLSSRMEPNYLFNRLNDIKPGMIQDATKNARIAADQFARDSQASLGKLRHASQGWFQVENRDPATPEQKVVRVVVDVQYEVK